MSLKFDGMMVAVDHMYDTEMILILIWRGNL